MPAATAALVAGIAFAAWRMPPWWLAAAGTAVCALTAALALRTHRTTATAAVAAGLFFLGATLTGLHSRPDGVSDRSGVCEIEILDERLPAPDSRTIHIAGRIAAQRNAHDRHWRQTRGRVWISVDTTLHLRAGDRVTTTARPRRPKAGNDFHKYLLLNGYDRHMYLSPRDTLRVVGGGPTLARRMHRRAVARIGSLPLQPRNRAVALAVGTGESSMLGRTARSEYSRAGTAHILALSGLHVGIVYLIINLLLRWVALVRFGNIIRCAAAVGLLWLYVLSTGMPPGAIRAALMFTMLQTARALSADYSSVNALSAAAFVSLCFNPLLLFDAGFRLSYISVAAIIFCAVPLCVRLHIRCEQHRNIAARCAARIVNTLTDTLAVGLVATAATAPLVSHLFGTIPLTGIAAAPAVIAAAAAVVALTAVWIALPFDLGAEAFGNGIDMAAGAMNSVSEWLATHGTALDIRLNGVETAVCYAVAAAVAIALASVRNNNSINNLQQK